ncbi:hypothetical protein GCM10020258_33650 [Sphingomonas yabuuchiae]
MKPTAPGSAEVVASRHAAILDVARRTGSVSVDELAEKLGVTPQTIRKDLNILAGQSMLARVHGGAVVTSGTDNLAYAERRSVAAPAKAAIGAAAAALVPNGASLFINIGSTTEAIARALVDHRDLMVITNNLNVVDILGGRPSIEVIAAGGGCAPATARWWAHWPWTSSGVQGRHGADRRVGDRPRRQLPRLRRGRGAGVADDHRPGATGAAGH